MNMTTGHELAEAVTLPMADRSFREAGTRPRSRRLWQIAVIVALSMTLAGCLNSAEPEGPPSAAASTEPALFIEPCELLKNDQAALAGLTRDPALVQRDDRERVCGWVDTGEGERQVVTSAVVGWGVDDEIAVGATLVEEVDIGAHTAAVLAITSGQDWCKVVFPITRSDHMAERSFAAVEVILWEGDACPTAIEFAGMVERRLPT